MKRKKYVAPETEMKTVELEQGFMNASANVRNPDESNGRIEEHQVNQDFGFTFDDNDWDSQSGSNN